MTECICRARMPQVDEADIPALLDYLTSKGVGHTPLVVEASSLRSVQHSVRWKVRAIARADVALLNKPCLVSLDGVVVDGNHRAAAARILRVLIPIILLHRQFAPVVEEIFTFPKTYAYGDGAFHPIRN